ncbi:uncharacterized protein RCO7_08134 [Rhynchosporium graminicola]|uniref:Uncharacterized protein n=1 Tax=Rhynchosporium graminicola TaxID=2792576 RepID=A0A1E1LDG8_9HELO|nr:uncharacterized protein RCO7_08134 [Rhynchosporium commune]
MRRDGELDSFAPSVCNVPAQLNQQRQIHKPLTSCNSIHEITSLLQLDHHPILKSLKNHKFVLPMPPHSKLEPCELSPDLADLLQRTFSESPPELAHVYQNRPKPSIIRKNVDELMLKLSQEPPPFEVDDGSPEAIEMTLRSIQGSWDIFEVSVTSNGFVRTPLGVSYEIVSIEGEDEISLQVETSKPAKSF